MISMKFDIDNDSNPSLFVEGIQCDDDWSCLDFGIADGAVVKVKISSKYSRQRFDFPDVVSPPLSESSRRTSYATPGSCGESSTATSSVEQDFVSNGDCIIFTLKTY